MRVITLFDLPVATSAQRKEYARFRKFLIKSGFIMMQESVYSKLVLNTTASNAVVENLRKSKPSSGLVQVIVITERQYTKIEYIVGESKSDTIDSDERLLIL